MPVSTGFCTSQFSRTKRRFALTDDDYSPEKGIAGLESDPQSPSALASSTVARYIETVVEEQSVKRAFQVSTLISE